MATASGQNGGTSEPSNTEGAGIYSTPTAARNNNTWNDMTDAEKKKRASGLCCFNMLGLVSTAGFICGVYSFAHCDFLSRYVEIAPEYRGDYVQACNDLGYDTVDVGAIATGTTMSNSVDMGGEICSSMLQSHGIGFSYWQATIPVDQTVCFTYTQLTPWGYVSPVFDSAFHASSWFSCLGYIFGGAAWFTLTCSTCCRIDQTRLKGIACYFWVACFFQGLSLIMFKSKVCDKGFFQSYFIPPSQQNNSTLIDQYNSIVQDVQCDVSLGSKMAISATVLYFICSLMVPFAIVPFYETRAYGAGADNYGADDYQDQATNNYGDNQQQPTSAPTEQGPVVQGTVTAAV